MKDTTKVIGMGALALVAVLMSAYTALASEGSLDKKHRLERSYEATTAIVLQADEAIQKQHEIKALALETRDSITIDLSSLKIEIEMAKDEPNMEEVRRLSGKIADASLGLK